MTLLLPPLALLPALLAAAALVLLGWSLRAPVRQARHEAHPSLVIFPPAPLTPPGSEAVTWLDGPPPGLTTQGSRMVPSVAACATGECSHRAHRQRPRTRPIPYPARTRAGAR